MRDFSTDAPEFFAFTVDGVSYQIPLAASMPTKILMKMEDGIKNDQGFRSQLEILRLYMGDIVDELPTGVASDILKAWQEESTRQGASPGESSALSD